MIKRNSFVVFDVSLKFFGLAFTLLANYFLSKQSFNELSYFRTTLTMFVGLTTTGLSYYILNYHNKFIPDKDNRSIYLSTILFFFAIGMFVAATLLIFFPETLNLSGIVDDRVLFFVAIIIFGTFTQLCIYILKSARLLDNIAIPFFISTIIFLGLSGMTLLYIDFVYEILFLYYALTAILFFMLLFKEYRSIVSINDFFNNPFSAKEFKDFIVPSYLESFLSVPRTWITIFVFSTFVGFEKIGDILIIQMIFNLFVFVIQSIVMNEFDRIDVYDINSRTSYLSSINKKLDVLLWLYIFVVVFLHEYIMGLLNLTEISGFEIILLSIATLIQCKILPIGVLFKRMEFAKVSFNHNLFFTVLLVITTVAFIYLFNSIGYGMSYAFSWGMTLVYILWSSVRLNIVHIKTSLLMLLVMIVFIVSTYSLLS